MSVPPPKALGPQGSGFPSLCSSPPASSCLGIPFSGLLSSAVFPPPGVFGSLCTVLHLSFFLSQLISLGSRYQDHGPASSRPWCLSRCFRVASDGLPSEALLCRGHCISRQGLCPIFSALYLVVGGQGPLCVAGSPVHCRVLSDPGLYPLVSDMVWDGPGGNEVGGYCSHMSFFRDRSPLPVAQRRGDTLESSPLQSCTLVYRLAPRLWASVPPSSLAHSSITQ